MESNTFVNPFLEDAKYQQCLDKLSSLRSEGEDKIIALRDEIRDVKANRTLEKSVKEKIVENDKKLMEAAKEVKASHKEEVRQIIREISLTAKEEGKKYYEQENAIAKEEKASAKQIYLAAKAKVKENHEASLAKVKEENTARLVQAEDPEALKRAKKESAIALKANRVSYHSALEECKADYEIKVQAAKDRSYNAFLAKDNFMVKTRNGHRSIPEIFENKYRTYLYEFKIGSWLLKNALNIIVILFFLFSIFYGLGIGKNLFTEQSIMSILGQSSVKVFYALGVAGLILLGGTDLSVGRMTGLGAGFFNMILARQVYPSAFGFTIDVVNWPIVPKVILAFLVPILLCTFFSAIAGFFTAKFKMHPFITTLSTQLLIYGLFMIGYGSYPAFNADLTISKALRGQNYLNIIIAAVIVIAIVWFIWNKTKFGKNMYAVGGNSEAASVSGVSVFWTTLLVFIMAGILYGLGGAATALQGAGANPNTGYGTELDAIAACVIGGVSFSGGIGKISGVVLGTIIFQGMTYCLTFLGFDINIQYVFKGIIIMAAVCLDSVKYLKKK